MAPAPSSGEEGRPFSQEALPELSCALTTGS